MHVACRVVNTAPAKPGESGKNHEVPHTTYATARLYSAFVVSCSLSSLEPVCCFVMFNWKELVRKRFCYSGGRPIFD